MRHAKARKTVEAIAEVMKDYAGRMERGYLPAGFTLAPMPFCARVTLNGRVLAEWSGVRTPRGATG